MAFPALSFAEYRNIYVPGIFVSRLPDMVTIHWVSLSSLQVAPGSEKFDQKGRIIVLAPERIIVGGVVSTLIHHPLEL